MRTSVHGWTRHRPVRGASKVAKFLLVGDQPFRNEKRLDALIHVGCRELVEEKVQLEVPMAHFAASLLLRGLLRWRDGALSEGWPLHGVVRR